MKLFVLYLFLLYEDVLGETFRDKILKTNSNADVRRRKTGNKDGDPEEKSEKSIIQPGSDTQNSSAHYSKDENLKNLVYGNLDNLGITYGKTLQRLPYTNFRKARPILVIVVEVPKSVHDQRNSVDPLFEEYPKKKVLKAVKRPKPDFEWINNLIQRRQRTKKSGKPEEPPGHSLIQPNSETLKSSANFPKGDDEKTRVYGNLDNVGITYGKTLQRLQYSNFRKSHPWIIVELDPRFIKAESDSYNSLSEEYPEARRKGHLKSNFRNRLRGETKYSKKDRSDSSSRSSSSSTASDETDIYGKNPDNPFTVHKEKYKQNFMWNTKLDGDHMNINPHGPMFNELGPSGAALFFNRKWWYYNQDDYKPLN